MQFGLVQHVLQWLTSYLSGRQQHAFATSNAILVLSGVPQGSGPLLYPLSLVPLSEESKMSMYADDILCKPILTTLTI